MSVDVSFRTGNYQDYVNEVEHIPGCIYYLYEYNDPSDENSGIKNTYIFLNDLQYNTESGGSLSIIPMEKFGNYSFNSQDSIGTIEPTAQVLRINGLQVTPINIFSDYDVVNKQYVDSRTVDPIIIYASDSIATKKLKIAKYLNGDIERTPLYYETTIDSEIYIRPLSRMIKDSTLVANYYYLYFDNIQLVEQSGSPSYLDLGGLILKVNFVNSEVVTLQTINYRYTPDRDITDAYDADDGFLANIGQIKTYVESHTATWQTI